MDAEYVREREKRRCFYSLVWIVVLLILVWPLALMVVPFYVFLLPFENVEPIGTVVKQCNEFLVR